MPLAMTGGPGPLAMTPGQMPLAMTGGPGPLAMTPGQRPLAMTPGQRPLAMTRLKPPEQTEHAVQDREGMGRTTGDPEIHGDGSRPAVPDFGDGVPESIPVD